MHLGPLACVTSMPARIWVSGCVLARQAYGMHGWRCGYVAYPNHDGQDYIGEHLIR